MNARIWAWIAASVVCTSAWAAPGEPAGAYGGGTSGDAIELTMEHADQNGDGVVNRTEARRVGIEQFDAADQDNDGVLDPQELSLVERSGNADPASTGELTTKPEGNKTAAGEAGGAYGGGTQVDTPAASLKNVDEDGDGVVSPAEARRAGIERFEEADKNRDGVLDEAELAALEAAADNGAPAPKVPDNAAPTSGSKP